MSVVKCFVVGCSRSGTTLTSVLLDRHSALAMTPETAFYRDFDTQFSRMNPASLIDVLETWPRLTELGLNVDDVRKACGQRVSRRRVVEAMLSLFAHARGKPYCGEKTPGHWRERSIKAILEDFPQATILFLMRDGRDTALSLRSMPFWPHGLEAAGRLWIDAARTCRAVMASDPDRVLLVRYENLVTHPRETLEPIMATLGLGFEDRQLDVSVTTGVVLERSLQWKGRALKTIETGRIGSWRSAATASEAEDLIQLMAPELEYFGYSAR